LTEFPVSTFVSFTVEPIGRLRDAAVRLFGLYRSPLLVQCPAKSALYREAVTIADDLCAAGADLDGRSG
jgi:hypothetical protein